MDLDKLHVDLDKAYNRRFTTIDKRIAHSIEYLNDELNIDLDKLSLQEVKTITTTILDIETLSLKEDVQQLLVQKEQIERALEKKHDELQESKCKIFNAIEENLNKNSDSLITKLHQVKLQSVDLYDMLGEMVESAIITALEKEQDGDMKEITQEVVNNITYETIKEGSLNTIRIRKILSTILQSAIDVAEATPTKADEILDATIHGMRSGLIHSIDRFKKRLAYTPVEAKHILIEDYDTIMEDLNQTDTIFSQVVQTQANENMPETKKILLDINTDMRYDLEELVKVSKETADVMREKFSSFTKSAVKKADTAMNSQTAQDAKRMGTQAWGAAKTALGSAIKTAKGAMDKK